jgi:hypothetical protein
MEKAVQEKDRELQNRLEGEMDRLSKVSLEVFHSLCFLTFMVGLAFELF